MKFLVDEDLPRSVAPLIRKLGYHAEDVRDLGLRGAPDAEIAAYARINKFCLVTADGGFANILNYSPRSYSGFIVLELPPRATSPVILNLLRELFTHTDLIETLTGKLAVVAFGRVRLRET